MTSVTIRHVPDASRDELAARAARRGQSLQEYLLRLLVESAAAPDIDDVMDRVARRKARTAASLDTHAIIDHRDAARGGRQELVSTVARTGSDNAEPE